MCMCLFTSIYRSIKGSIQKQACCSSSLSQYSSISSFSAIMSNKKIEFQVQIFCEKCKTTIMTTAAKLVGVNSISLDADKGVLTIIGTGADAMELVQKLRKAKISAMITSCVPEKKVEKKEEKKDEKKIECMPMCYCHCKQPRYGYGFPIVYYEQESNCTIL